MASRSYQRRRRADNENRQTGFETCRLTPGAYTMDARTSRFQLQRRERIANMDRQALNRRQFIRTTAVLTGAAMFGSTLVNSARGVEGPTTAPAGSGKRTASDQVPLGKT